MNHEQFKLFKRITLDYFAKLSPDDQPVMGEPHMHFGDPELLDYTSLIQINGEYEGCIYLTSPVAMLRDVLLINGEVQDSPAHLKDMCQEFSNVLSGNASKAFGGELADLGAAVAEPRRGAVARSSGVDLRHADPLARPAVAARGRTAGGGMIILPQSVFRRAKEPVALDRDLRLRALEWALYFAVTGKETMAELAKQFHAERAECGDALQRLMQLGLVEERMLDANEYVHALTAAADREEKSLREFLSGAMQPEPPRPRLREVSRPRPAFGFKPLPLPDEQKEKRSMSSGSRKLSLRALMDVIERQAGSREAGQLDIYRVFVRIDTLLLKRNGIETLRFAEDRLISDPELEQALVRSVKRTLGLDCPEDVWVA